MESSLPYVSVCIITYNQAGCIRKTVESALAQKTSFPFEIIIGDDCSTDETREILAELKKNNPEKIVLNLLPEKGKGIPGKENFLTSLELCRGKYTAFLDGDDYWTDESKLQKQADFLDKNPEFALCHHDCHVSKDYETNVKYIFNRRNVVSGFTEACQINFAFYLSVMYRSEITKSLDMRYWIGDLFMGDWPLWCLITRNGKAYFINEKMGYYTPQGLSRIPHNIYSSARITFFNRLLDNNYYPDRKFLQRLLSRYYLLNAADKLNEHKIGDAMSNIGSSAKFFLKGAAFKSYSWINRLRLRSILLYLSFSFLNLFRKA